MLILSSTFPVAKIIGGAAMIVCAVWGAEGSGKTTFALTFPQPIFHLDLDVGGFARAIWRLDSAKITSKSYPTPIQMEKLMGAKKIGATVRFPRQVIGFKEVWQQIVVDFVAACQDKEINTIVVDSATQLWNIAHTSFLQEKQEIQMAKGITPEDDRFREQLQPVEFPNDRIRSIIYTARSCGKNLVLTHYPRNIYRERATNRGIEKYKTDEIEPDGFRDTRKLVDVVFWVWADNARPALGTQPATPVMPLVMPRAKITDKCGLEGMGMSAVGLELPEASYQGLLKLREFMQGGE